MIVFLALSSKLKDLSSSFAKRMIDSGRRDCRERTNMENRISQLASDMLGNRRYSDGPMATGVGGAVLWQSHAPTKSEPALYCPLLCLTLVGEKEVQCGALAVRCAEGNAVLVSHDLPVSYRISKASTSRPYIALVIPLDIQMLRGLDAQIPDAGPEVRPSGAISTFQAPEEIVDSACRLLELAGNDQYVPVLSPIVLQELHARLLLSSQGNALRHLLWRDEPSRQVTKAIERMRNSITNPMSVTELAASVGMSRSSLHSHFKDVTGLSPSQYQKDLRLLEARRLLTESKMPISAVAIEIGYESPAQFSRDFAQKFENAPRNYRKALLIEAS